MPSRIENKCASSRSKRSHRLYCFPPQALGLCHLENEREIRLANVPFLAYLPRCTYSLGLKFVGIARLLVSLRSSDNPKAQWGLYLYPAASLMVVNSIELNIKNFPF